MFVPRSIVLVAVLGGAAPMSCTDGRRSPTADPHPVLTPETKASPDTKAGPETKVATKATPRAPLPADMPAAMECKAHEDCVVMPTAPGGDPCCDVTVTIGPRNREYLARIAAYREQACDDVECPPLELPGARPAPCGEVPRCLKGQCDIACNDPTYDPSAPPAAATPPADVAPCLRKCIDERRMQAISAAAIEARCKSECGDGKAR